MTEKAWENTVQGLGKIKIRIVQLRLSLEYEEGNKINLHAKTLANIKVRAVRFPYARYPA